jgi:hypothetical protein
MDEKVRLKDLYSNSNSNSGTILLLLPVPLGAGILAHRYVHYFETHTSKTCADTSPLDMGSVTQVIFSRADYVAVRSAQVTRTEGEARAAERR